MHDKMISEGQMEIEECGANKKIILEFKEIKVEEQTL